LLVGYFVLGPSDLYKLTKEIGKFIQNVRTLGTDVTKTFESNLESQLELEELRKAQRELNDAFSFRRSINVDKESDPFSTSSSSAITASAEVAGETATAAAAVTTTTTGTPKKKKKRIRRRKVKKSPVEEDAGTATADLSINNNVPDLDMSDIAESPATRTMDDETAARKREERLEKLSSETTAEDLEGADWLETPEWLKQEEAETGEKLKVQEPTAQDQDRFAKQLSGDWNQQILANEDKLSPLAKVMQQLALLEEEKIAADKRLEEEFRLRTELEEKYYEERRQILEEAAAEVQASAYVSVEGASSSSKETKKA
jgi:Sec-independent protein translocase protein TatA